jgi:hypothetical protein
VERIDRVERNRSRFIAETVAHKRWRRRRHPGRSSRNPFVVSGDEDQRKELLACDRSPVCNKANTG